MKPTRPWTTHPAARYIPQPGASFNPGPGNPARARARARACAKGPPTPARLQVRSRFRLAFPGRKPQGGCMRFPTLPLGQRGPGLQVTRPALAARGQSRCGGRDFLEGGPPMRPARRVPIGWRRGRRCALPIGCGRSASLRGLEGGCR